jgi:TPR repeat protein
MYASGEGVPRDELRAFQYFSRIANTHAEESPQLPQARFVANAFVQLTGVNHLLARATTGEIAEYGTLSQRNISPAATLELTSWLSKALAAQPPK